jgi:3-isopropylmalate/(R)-2-methylmalate dehydratase small subunit
MRAFGKLTAVAAPIDRRNVNTDMLIPSRFMRRPRDGRYGDYLFHDLRFAPDGAERADFVLNRQGWRGAAILVADGNFGCGSSRETAVYALDSYGVRAVIAPSFGDIFAANALMNGLLAVRLDDDTCAALRRQLHDRPGALLAVDLENQTVTAPDGTAHRFDIGAFEKDCLLRGLDDVDLTLAHRDAIEAFERRARAADPWLFPPPAP